MHVPIALNIETEFPTTVITAQSCGGTQTVVLGRQLELDAHHTPGEHLIMFHLSLAIRQSRGDIKRRNASRVLSKRHTLEPALILTARTFITRKRRGAHSM
ncbi:MAG: hypothetical protein WA728_16370 [Xanthobacteraceae bacterium]